MKSWMFWGIAGTLLLLTLVQVYTYLKRKYLEREREKTEELLQQDGEHYRQVVETAQELKYLRHDLQKQADVMEKISEDPISPLLEQIVEQKRQEAEKLGVIFRYETEPVLTSPLRQGETISLLANLPDNAIEACRACQESGMQPDIFLRFSKEEKGFHIWLENSKCADTHSLRQKLATTKPDSGRHGYGIKIIQRIVEQNQGYMTMQDEGIRFRTEIWIGTEAYDMEYRI